MPKLTRMELPGEVTPGNIAHTIHTFQLTWPERFLALLGATIRIESKASKHPRVSLHKR